MIRPARLAPYIGFTEEEVKALCKEKQMDYEGMRTWYDGALRDYAGNMLLVGINYDKETKKHSRVIEEA